MSIEQLFELHETGQIPREVLLVRLANLAYATGVFDRKLPYEPGQTAEMQALIEAGKLTAGERDQIVKTVYSFEKLHTTQPLDRLI